MDNLTRMDGICDVCGYYRKISLNMSDSPALGECFDCRSKKRIEQNNACWINKQYWPNKRILDACCGSKMFWFDKERKDVLFMDIRQEEFEIHGKKINVKPDVIGDFRKMPFVDESFYMVVFDPPHLKWAGPNSIMKAQYGQLDKETWKDDLRKGFSECFRVLKSNGTLIFKWSDCQIPVKKVLDLAPVKPLFGNQRGTTHWMAFFKDGVGCES